MDGGAQLAVAVRALLPLVEALAARLAAAGGGLPDLQALRQRAQAVDRAAEALVREGLDPREERSGQLAAALAVTLAALAQSLQEQWADDEGMAGLQGPIVAAEHGLEMAGKPLQP